MVNALNIRIAELTIEVQNLERNVMEMQSKWREMTGCSYIEKRARKILGMRYPERSEIFDPGWLSR